MCICPRYVKISAILYSQSLRVTGISVQDLRGCFQGCNAYNTCTIHNYMCKIIQIYSGITQMVECSRGALYTQNSEFNFLVTSTIAKLTFSPLFTELFHKDFSSLMR